MLEPHVREAGAGPGVVCLRATASALGVARLLTATLPRVEVIEFDGLGHMGPITHAEIVNQAVASFLERA